MELPFAAVLFDMDGVLEDSPAGIDAARAAGTRVLGLTTTHDPSELQGAELLLPDLVGIEVRRRGGDFVLGIDG